MSIKIPIETSARHIHAPRRISTLFGEGMPSSLQRELSQPDSICQERLTVKGPKG